MINEQVIKIYNSLSSKIPQDKMMIVPIMLLMIDPKTWKFPDGFRTKELQEIVDIIENCEELKGMFSAKGDDAMHSDFRDDCLIEGPQ